jgi:cytochrome oxidase assembly protein ShyY1
MLKRYGLFAVGTKRFVANGMHNSASPKPKTTDKLGIAVFSTISIVAVGLGIWQLRRYDEKVEKIKKTKKSLRQDMSTIAVNVGSQRELSMMISKCKDQKLDLNKGKFDHEHEVLLGPRPAPTGRLGAQAQGMATNPQVHNVIKYHRMLIITTLF